MCLEDKKRIFLKQVQVNVIEEACGNALRASLQHSGTYSNAVADRSSFQNSLKESLRRELEIYHYGVSEEDHLDRIQSLASNLSGTYSDILKNGRFRIGIAQKALNLYLKIAWCLNADFATPPHCPIDRGVLNHAGIYANWT